MRTHADPARLDAPPSATRLVALGDPHGASGRVRAVLADQRDAATLVVTVGDVVGYANGPRSSALVQLLEREGVRSVVGNHEDWIGRDGALAIVTDPGTVLLSRDAQDLIRAWPWDLSVRFPGAGDREVRVTHTLHTDTWTWVTDDAAAEELLDAVAPAQVVCIGHSHRPGVFCAWGPGAVDWLPFDFTRDDRLAVPLADRGRYVVDCGSLARPEVRRGARRPEWGTYGVIDLAAGRIELRRVGGPQG